MSHQDIYLSVYLLIIMQGWRLLFLISVVFTVIKQSTCGKPAPNYISHAPTPMTSLYVLCYVR